MSARLLPCQVRARDFRKPGRTGSSQRTVWATAQIAPTSHTQSSTASSSQTPPAARTRAHPERPMPKLRLKRVRRLMVSQRDQGPLGLRRVNNRPDKLPPRTAPPSTSPGYPIPMSFAVPSASRRHSAANVAQSTASAPGRTSGEDLGACEGPFRPPRCPVMAAVHQLWSGPGCFAASGSAALRAPRSARYCRCQ